MIGSARMLWANTIRSLNVPSFPDSGMGATASVLAVTESEESLANMSSMALISASLGFKGISK